ncbi:GlcNAc-transferase family protein [Ramlibacter albus]|uniref:Glycosyltransferase (GlcNAc) n=1 Tax=Ramlibacter albus TaxID=2079448 RepID=A0A923M429_9BURK|nr:GlcNAc-transferase family protein [Ramlibacter albus]MBC5763575.1 hypothetical protein [Ramlibacter albus]
MSIFLSIAAYCDPLLPFTIERALATARNPEALHFGVVEQAPGDGPRPAASSAAPGRISYVRIDPVDARGPCWARAIAMSLYDGEDFFFQIDSHMDFDPGWDEMLCDQLRTLMAGRRGAVISSYPNPFVFEDGKPVRRNNNADVLVHVVKTGTNFEPGHPVLSFEAHPVPSPLPIEGIHLGAGCLFAPGSIVQLFPYDPFLYFHGEEQSMTMRLYTHGWDIFHIPNLPVFHLYNNADAGAPPRPMHWDAAHESQRAIGWWLYEQRARGRLAQLVANAPLGVYGLGRIRTVAEYAAFSGIDYAARTLEPKAWSPLRVQQ